MKKICILLLSLALILSAAACGSKSDGSSSGDDPLMVTVNGIEIHQKLYEYFLNYFTDYISESIAEGDSVFNHVDDIKEQALNACVSLGAVESVAKERGIDVTDAQLAETWSKLVADSGGTEAEVEKKLEENGMNKDVFLTISRYNMLNDALFASMYGEKAELLPDSDVDEFLANNNLEFFMAKHILLTTESTDGTGATTELSEEEKAALREQLEGYLTTLRALSGAEREAKFDELMAAYSEDPGSKTHPEGYVFADGDMVTEFYEGTRSIEIGEVSDIVTTSYGYHIIMRMPLDYDVVPSRYSSYLYYGYEEYELTLRYMVADSLYNVMLQDWTSQAVAEPTDTLNNYDGNAHMVSYTGAVAK